jgi:hypothetical protein
MEKKVIGRKEKITLPDLGLKSVWAKIDTGAFTSSIHAEEIREVDEDGKKVLKFEILMQGHKDFTGRTLTFEEYKQKKVKNSFGQAETRYLVVTKVKIAGETFSAEFTLSDRSSMKNSILLGRKILQDKFLVDVNRVNLSKAYRIKQ